MEDILITIVNSMEKRLIFVDDYHIIKYLNNAAKEHYLNKGYNIHWLGCSCREDYKRLAKDYTEVTMDTAELVNLGSNFSSYLEGKEVENKRRPDFETYTMSKEELDTLMNNLKMLKDI